MKKFYKSTLALVVVMALCFTACSEDDNAPVEEAPPAGEFVKAKVNGVQFETVTAGGLTSVYATRTGTGENTQMIVVGNNANFDAVGFTTHSITATGTYQLNQEIDVAGMIYGNGTTDISYGTTECPASSGTLTITFIDETRVAGTFQFTAHNEDDCADGRTVTEGSFNAIFNDE